MIYAMHFLVVETRVLGLAFASWNAIDIFWLVLKDIGNKNVLAHIFWQVAGFRNLNPEENLLVQKLLRLIDEEVVIGLTITTKITRPVGALDLASHASLTIGIRGKNRRLSFALQGILQILQLQVTLTDEDRLGWVPEGILSFVSEVGHFA